MTSSAGARSAKIARRLRSEIRPQGARLAVYLVVAVAVLSLPLVGAPGLDLAPAARASVVGAETISELGAAARALPLARARDVLVQSRVPTTLVRDGPAEVRSYTVEDGDTLLKIAADFGVTVETVAYNNDVTDATRIHPGNVFRIPPVDGAIYKVKDGDTVEKVAALFKVEVKAINDANRLYFEPQNFGPGREILVPVSTARFPNFELKDAPKAPLVVSVPIAAPQPRPTNARLAWPVGGVITQYFWYGHQGVDVAAPYGTGIGASDAGTVSAVGWVAVGGLRVCVKHDWGMETCYYHTSATHVFVGQRVARGQIIAAIGLTGVTTGPHVHWEARYNGVLVNPLQY